MTEAPPEDFLDREGEIVRLRAPEGRQPRRRFPLVAFDKIQVATGSPYLVKGLIPREGLVVIWGPPKCGKTFWTFDLAMHVALGWEYRGRRVAAGTVVYVACEGERGLAARAEAFRLSRMGAARDVPAFYLLATRLGLASDVSALIGDIEAQLGEQGCVAIVIDTLNRSIEGSESDDADMGRYVKAADAIREVFRCAVIVIHHCGVDGTRPRGHTSLTGAADAQIAVKRNKSDNVVTATVEWMKDGPEGDEIASMLKTIEVAKDDDGEPITSCVIEPSDGPGSPAKRAVKINAVGRQALDLLHQAMLASPVVAPASEHVPAGVQGVTKTVWRGYCEKAGIINPEGNPREQLRRIIVTLKDAGNIGVWDDFVWPVTSRHKASP